MISEKRLEQALTYLASTDDECAELHTESERAEFKAKVIKNAMLDRLTGSVADRTAQAESSPEYVEAMNAHFDLLAKWEAMRNKRGTESIVVDVWRSINASRRQGNV